MKRSFDTISENENTWEGDAGIEVLPSQVPKYLWGTVFYNGLNINDDDPFFIPAQNMKATTSVYSLKDAEELLNTARYWGLEQIPASLLPFTMSQKYTNIAPILKQFVMEYPVLNTYLSLVDDRTPITSRLEIAMELGSLEAIKALRRQPRAFFTARGLSLAAEHNHMDCLRYALSSQRSIWKGKESVFRGAVRNGHLNCIEQLRRYNWSLTEQGDNLAPVAAAHNQYDVLDYLQMAAMYKRWDCVQYLIANGASMSSYLSELLINSNEIALLHFAVNKGCPLSNAVGIYFARTGNLYQLRWAYANKCGLSANMLYVAAKEGHFRCLQFNHEACLKEAAAAEQEWLHYTFHVSRGSVRLGDIPAIAATEKHWKCLEYLVEQGYPTDKFLSHQLVSAGRIAFYHYARDGLWTAEVTRAALQAGHRDCFQYAVQHGCPVSH
eukprot:gene13436-15471_t